VASVLDVQEHVDSIDNSLTSIEEEVDNRGAMPDTGRAVERLREALDRLKQELENEEEDSPF
jgi:archaellum component FlaC